MNNSLDKTCLCLLAVILSVQSTGSQSSTRNKIPKNPINQVDTTKPVGAKQLKNNYQSYDPYKDIPIIFDSTELSDSFTYYLRGKNLKSSYIMFQYLGDQDKPIPNIVFYIDTFDISIMNFGYSFKVSDREFNNIAKVIEGTKSLEIRSDYIYGRYNFSIFRENNRLNHLTYYKLTFFQVVNQITWQISDSTERQYVKEGFRRALSQ